MPITISFEEVSGILEYDAMSGEFVWKKRTPDLFVESARRSAEHKCNNWNARFAGTKAGTISLGGYLVITIFGTQYRANRIAWLLMTGRWPSTIVDHRDTDTLNNKWGNLRLADPTQSRANTKMAKNNTSGFKGVTWFAPRQKWVANLSAYGRNKFLGYFDEAESAAAAYNTAAQETFGEFARCS